MANRYVIKFSKTGYVKYTSHLDLLRMFKRAFKKADLGLSYSQGFNPHPKMSFAQPLSLGYAGRSELIELETARPHQTAEILRAMQGQMPQGIEILACYELPAEVKSLAAAADSAAYRIWILTDKTEAVLREDLRRYLQQNEILAMKRMKKTKKKNPSTSKQDPQDRHRKSRRFCCHRDGAGLRQSIELQPGACDRELLQFCRHYNDKGFD